MTSYWLAQARRVVISLVLVVASLAAARAINDGVVPPAFVTVPIVVLAVGAAVALDVLFIYLIRAHKT